MITSANNSTGEKHHTAESEGKSQKRAGTVCGRRPEDVQRSSGELDPQGICGRIPDYLMRR